MANRPIHEIRLGKVKAAIWRNETDSGIRYSVAIVRIFRTDNGWESSPSFGRDELPLVAKVADRVHSWIYEQNDRSDSVSACSCLRRSSFQRWFMNWPTNCCTTDRSASSCPKQCGRRKRNRSRMWSVGPSGWNVPLERPTTFSSGPDPNKHCSQQSSANHWQSAAPRGGGGRSGGRREFCMTMTQPARVPQPGDLIQVQRGRLRTATAVGRLCLRFLC